MQLGTGLRYNSNKNRISLIPSWALSEVGKVFTYGANKYTVKEGDKVVVDGSNNWKAGMEWSKVLESLERHLNAFKQGEDFDPESGLYHLAHLATNTLFLLEYQKIYPQGDDRGHLYLRVPKIGLDIDEVLCDWVGGWKKKFGNQSHLWEEVENWKFDYDLSKKYASMTEEEMNEFYINLQPRIKPSEIPFEPHCYITSRKVPTELTKQWLQLHGFPTAEVYSVGHGESKVPSAKKSGVQIFVDDSYENFVDLNNNGIFCFLLTTPHNKRYNVGNRRIDKLQELKFFLQ